MSAPNDSCPQVSSQEDDGKSVQCGKDDEGLKTAELQEEARFKSRYPQNVRPGGPLLLQKRLNRGQKYFDSGDYNMAKAKGQKPRVPPVIPQNPTGETIPTVESLPPRKASLVQSKLATGLS